MRQKHNAALGNSARITAGLKFDEVWLRFEGRGSESIAISMNEFQASDIIKALQPYATDRP